MEIADHGRLLYLKKALQKKSHIYESDKNFLKIIRSKVAESKRKPNLRRNSDLLSTQTKKIANQPHNKLNQNLLGTNSEKVLLAMMHEMHELKKRQLRMTDQLQVLNTKLTTSKDHIPEYTNPIHEDNESQPKQENKNKPLEKSSKIMIWATAGLSVVWYAGFMNVVNLEPIREVFLGTAIGFAAGVILLHRIRKKYL